MFYSNISQHLVLHDLIWYYRTKHNIAYLQFWWKHQQIKTRSLRKTPWKRHTSFFTGFPPANKTHLIKRIYVWPYSKPPTLVFHLFFGHLSELLLLLLLFWEVNFSTLNPQLLPEKKQQFVKILPGSFCLFAPRKVTQNPKRKVYIVFQPPFFSSYMLIFPGCNLFRWHFTFTAARYQEPRLTGAVDQIQSAFGTAWGSPGNLDDRVLFEIGTSFWDETIINRPGNIENAEVVYLHWKMRS